MKLPLLPKLFRITFTLAALLAFSMADAQIASWTYEPLQGATATPVPNTGSGSSSIVNLGGGTITPGTRTGMAGSGCGNQNGVTAWALEPFDPGSINEKNGAQFSTSTANYQNIFFTWDQRWSNTAPNTVRLQYTTNGSTWTNFTMTSANTSFCNGSINANGCFETNSSGDQYRRITVDFTALTAANNNPNFGVRLVAAYYQGTTQFRQTAAPGSVAGTAGTWRFDNVAFTGTLMPGPNPSVMSGTTAICAGDSANIKVTITGGTSPYTVVYSDGSTNTTVNNYVSAANISVTPASTRTYTIVSVTDANGLTGTGNSGSAVITVNPLPTVTAANITTCATGAVTMTGGSPAGGTYSIGSSYSGPSTTFTYTYMNGNGCSKTSVVYTFTRNSAPVISVQPSTATQTVCQGEAFSAITITATGTATLTYQWYSNTTQSTTGGTPLTTAAHIANGSKTASYIPLSAVTGTLYYYVTVSNGCGSIKSGNATGAFIVAPATVAGTVSAPQTICAGSLPSDLTLSGHSGSVVKWQKADNNTFTVGLQDIVNTTATLTSAQMGALFQTTYFRAVVQNGTCLSANTLPVEILIKSTTWNGSWSNGLPDSVTSAVFNAAYTSSGDLNACSVIVNSGDVVFQPGHTLTIENGLYVVGGSLTFENNASLVQVSNTPNSGPINYKRKTTPVRKFDYTYWSSPVDLQILAAFSPLTLSDKYFWWDTSIYNWHNVTAPGITPMDTGKGYIIRSPQSFDPVTPSVFEGTFSGVPNNGDYIVPIAISGADNLNLLGNPYPCALSADLFMLDVANSASLGTGTSLYFWTHNTPITSNDYTANDYAIYNFSGGTGTAPAPGNNNNIPNGFIAAGEAFMIEGLANGTATFKNSMRVAGNNDQFFRTSAHSNAGGTLEKNRVWLEFKSNQGAYKQLLVGYIENATNNTDRGFDAVVQEAGNPVSFYSVQANDKLSIQGRALPFAPADTVPLGYRAVAAGTFEIALSDFDGLFHQQGIYLEDTLLNHIHDLKSGPYSFATAMGTFDGRFVLRYTENALGNEEPAFNENSVIVYKNSNGITIDAGTALLGNVKIFDLAGRLVFDKNEIGSSQITINSLLEHTVFIARIQSESGAVITRKILN